MVSGRSVRFVEARLRAGEAAWLSHRGGSMAPALRDGDRLRVTSLRRALAPGAIVLARRGGRLVAHRLVRLDGDLAITRGDACASDDPAVPASAIVGEVERVERPPSRLARAIVAGGLEAQSKVGAVVLALRALVRRASPGLFGLTILSPSLAAISVARAEGAPQPPCYCIDLDPHAIAEIAQHEQIEAAARVRDQRAHEGRVALASRLRAAAAAAAAAEAKDGDGAPAPEAPRGAPPASDETCASVAASRLFPKDGDRLTRDGKALVTSLARVLEGLGDARVIVHGDVEPPLPGRKWDEGFDRSTRYATRVTRALIEGGVDPLRLTVIGHGGTRSLVVHATPAPDDDEDRGASATLAIRERRVELCIEPAPAPENTNSGPPAAQPPARQ